MLVAARASRLPVASLKSTCIPTCQKISPSPDATAMEKAKSIAGARQTTATHKNGPKRSAQRFLFLSSAIKGVAAKGWRRSAVKPRSTRWTLRSTGRSTTHRRNLGHFRGAMDGPLATCASRTTNTAVRATVVGSFPTRTRARPTNQGCGKLRIRTTAPRVTAAGPPR